MKSQIIDVTWRTPNPSCCGDGVHGIDQHCLGYVLVKQKNKEFFRAYMGIVNSVSEEWDAISIKERGAKMLLEEAKAFFPEYNLSEENFRS